jgi:DNA-directed RNA polymerase specialized sigma24 family protein
MAEKISDSSLEKTLRALLLINLQSMKQKQQIALLDKARFGQSEIAEVVGSTPKAVSVRLAEIRKEARKGRDRS